MYHTQACIKHAQISPPPRLTLWRRAVGPRPLAAAAAKADCTGTAAAASAARWAAGAPLSPLDGVPFAVKDCVDALPYPTTSGTAFMADWWVGGRRMCWRAGGLAGGGSADRPSLVASQLLRPAHRRTCCLQGVHCRLAAVDCCCRRTPQRSLGGVEALQEAGALLVGKATLHEIGEAWGAAGWGRCSG